MSRTSEPDCDRLSTRDWLARLREVVAGVPRLRFATARQAVAAPYYTMAGDGAAIVSSTAATEAAAPAASKSGQRPKVQPPSIEQAEDTMNRAARWLLKRQHADGFWVAELECDNTTESYFVLFYAFLGKRGHPKARQIAQTIRKAMLPTGGWAGYFGGPADISISVLSYFALKIAGISADELDMRRSRDVILKLGGAPRANTYTKYHLAWFDQYDWEHVPAIPPEMIFIPSIAPINIYEMSSWSRTIFVPLSIIYALKPVCPLPQECHVDELFPEGHTHRDLALQRTKESLSWTNFFLLTDKALKMAEIFPINPVRQVAIKRAEQWMIERFEHSGGLGAILPAMMNSVLALKILGHKEDEPLLKEGIRHLDELEVPAEDGSIRIQPCHSPVWDTAISTYALTQCGFKPADLSPAAAVAASKSGALHAVGGEAAAALRQACDWLLSKEVKRPGDWQVKNNVPPSGWYFEYANEFYPDVDDTIMVMMALRSSYTPGASVRVDAAIRRAMTWVLGMQNVDGGWASFDRDNDLNFLTKVPFADHNAMIDPSTSDITSRVLEMLAIVEPENYTPDHAVVQRGLNFIKQDQCKDGSWFGRWGVNYMYGTWQVLRGLRLIGEDMSKGYVRKAVEWFKEVQLPDGGWGERCDTYYDPSLKGKGPSTASQTSWALMGLLAAGQGNSQTVARGVKYLIDTQTPDGTWNEDEWTGTGFPKVFYLKYNYYRHYWPMKSLAHYKRFLQGLRP